MAKGIAPEQIAALSFYRSQCTEIKKQIMSEIRKELANKVNEQVVTVVKSQGR